MKILFFLKKELVNYKYNFLVGILLLIIATLVSYIYPQLVILCIDEIIPRKEKDILIIIIVISLFLNLIKNILIFFYNDIFIKIREKIANKIQLDTLNYIFELKYFEFDNIDDERKYSYLTKDINNIKIFLDYVNFSLLKDISNFTIGIIVTFFISFKISMLILITIILAGIYSFIKCKYIKKIDLENNKMFGKLLKYIMDPIYFYLPIKVLGIAKLFIEKFAFFQNKYFSHSLILSEIKLKLKLKNGFITDSLGVFVLFFLGIDIINGYHILGQLVGYNLYFFMIISSYNSLSNFNIDIQTVKSSVENLVELSRMDNEKYLSNYSLEYIKKIEFKNVSFKYPKAPNRFSLNQVSFELEEGEILAIIGPNGSGKSTLIKILVGLYNNYTGNVLVNNIDLKNLDIKEFRNNIGYIPQENFFLDDTLLANIILNLPLDREKLERTLNMCKLTEFISQLNKNINNNVSLHKNFLSSGFQQRVSFARALYKEPKMLILDEATSHSDPKFEYFSKQLLESYKKNNIPIIMITHRMSNLEIADKILVIENGIMIDFGRKEDILARSSFVQKFLDYQQVKLNYAEKYNF